MKHDTVGTKFCKLNHRVLLPYFGGPGFKYKIRDPGVLKDSVFFFSPSRQLLGYYLKLGHDHFLLCMSSLIVRPVTQRHRESELLPASLTKSLTNKQIWARFLRMESCCTSLAMRRLPARPEVCVPMRSSQLGCWDRNICRNCHVWWEMQTKFW
jgi:hypothetical protein